MAKRARVVEKSDPDGFTPRMASADFFDVNLSVSSTEIEAEDLDGPGCGLDAAHRFTSKCGRSAEDSRIVG
jgi:hypothetical protein